MSRKVELHLDTLALQHLDFLCAAYKQPARVVVAEILHGAFEGVRDALTRRQAELEHASQDAQPTSERAVESVGGTETPS